MDPILGVLIVVAAIINIAVMFKVGNEAA